MFTLEQRTDSLITGKVMNTIKSECKFIELNFSISVCVIK